MPSLSVLRSRVAALPGTARLVEALAVPSAEVVAAAPAGARPILVSALAPTRSGAPVLAVTATGREAEDLRDAAFGPVRWLHRIVGNTVHLGALIDTEIVGARGILLSIAGGEDLTLLEVNEAAEVVRQAATDDTNIIFGATVDERLAGQVWVTVVATGLGGPRRASFTPSFPKARSAADTGYPSAPSQTESELPSFLR